MALAEWTYAYDTEPARYGQRCDCGELARIVFTFPDREDVPWCGEVGSMHDRVLIATLPSPVSLG